MREFISINEKATKYLLKDATKNVGWPRLSSLHCNTSDSLWILEGQGKPFFSVGGQRGHFFAFVDASDHLSKCGDVTEAELIMTS